MSETLYLPVQGNSIKSVHCECHGKSIKTNKTTFEKVADSFVFLQRSGGFSVPAVKVLGTNLPKYQVIAMLF